MNIVPGQHFDTVAPDGSLVERDLIALSEPDRFGNFDALDSDRVLVSAWVGMVADRG